jgi:hypothetical protein
VSSRRQIVSWQLALVGTTALIGLHLRVQAGLQTSTH